MSTRRTFRRLVGLLRPVWRDVIATAFYSLLTVMAGVGLMATSAWLISKASLQPSIADLGVAPTGVRMFGIMRGVFRYLERLTSHDLTFRLLRDVRVWFYEQIEPRYPSDMGDTRGGDLLARVVGDVDELQNFYLRAIAPPIVAVLTVLAMVVFYGVVDMWVMLVALAWMLVTVTALPALAWYTHQRPAEAAAYHRTEANALLVETLQGVADLSAYDAVSSQLAAFDAQQGALLRAERRAARLEALQNGLGVVVVHGAALSVLAVAIPRVEGILLATMMLAMTAAAEALTPLMETAQHLANSLTAGERLFALTDTPITDDAGESANCAPRDGAVHLDAVRFTYPRSDVPALDGVSLSVDDGEWVALVGASGIGKTTIANLLVRLYPPTAGTVSVGGCDVREVSPEVLRSHVSVMSQRTHLFNTTIRENIRLARRGASDEAIVVAAQGAQLHEFIMTLPEGYATVVGEDGGRLSAGQRQRLALARVLLTDARVWVLDEPTANLDAQTEAAVMATVREAARGRTVLFITHRHDLIAPSDRTVSLL